MGWRAGLRLGGSLATIAEMLREAAEYFHIGEKKMRQIVDENMDANFLLTSGNRVMIKRKLFEEYLNAASVI